jgi:Predicted membrane protein (DUF2142)
VKEGRLTRLMQLPRRHPTPLLVIGGFVLLGTAWILATPPGAYPDADAHYIRAIAASHGEFFGQPYTGPPLDPSRFRLGQARVFQVPAGLAVPSTFDCVAGNLTQPSVCSYAAPDNRTVTAQVSVEGTDTPLGYLLPALLMRLAKGPNGAELLGRIATLGTSLSLLGAAVALLWTRRSRLSPLIGLLLAVTPTVLFLGGEVGPNGLEPVATICFVAGLIRLGRGDADDPPRPWMFLATAIGAVVLALARPLGFAWVILDVVCWAPVFGQRHVLRLYSGRAARVALGSVLVAVGVSFAWERTNQLKPAGGLGGALAQVPGVFDLIPQYIGDFVGRFGDSDTLLPQPLVEPWVACVVILAGIAVAVGKRRERIGIAGLLVAVVVVLVGYASAFDSLLGGGLAYAQARHVLPFALLLPLFVGEVISRGAGRIGVRAPDRLFLWCAVIAAVVGVAAFYYDARRYAVGTLGRFLFFLPGHAAWSPPSGWVVLLAMAGLGGALLVVAALVDIRKRRCHPGDVDPEPDAEVRATRAAPVPA